VVLRPVFGPWISRCPCFETIEYVRGEDVGTTPNPQTGGPGYLCPAWVALPGAMLPSAYSFCPIGLDGGEVLVPFLCNVTPGRSF
jgi:hypothetical protein